jgi:transposase
VLETVREKFTCAAWETITETPAPFHAIPRGQVGPNLLAEITVSKFDLHMPLTRQKPCLYHRRHHSLRVDPVQGRPGRKRHPAP